MSKREDIETERDRLKGQIVGLKDVKSRDAAEIESLKKRNSFLEKEVCSPHINSFFSYFLIHKKKTFCSLVNLD